MSDLPAPVDLVDGGPADIDAVDAIMQAAFDPRYGEAWTKAQCLGMMSLPGVWLTIAHDPAGATGFALTRAIAGDAELLLLAVRPEAQGRGIGRALLRAAIDGAMARGAERICLEMRANNGATRLYQREAFQKRGERRQYYAGNGGERFDAHTYVRSLCRTELQKSGE